MGPMHPTSPIALFSAFALAFALAGEARADWVKFSGTHAIKFAHNGVIKEVSASGTGVAIANGKAGPLHTLQLTRPFAKITETAFATTEGEGLEEVHFDGVRINPDLAGKKGMPGVFAPILAAVKGTTMTALTRSTLPAAGTIRLCNVTGCDASVAVKLTQVAMTPPTSMGVEYAIGPGVGDNFTVVGMSGPLRSMTPVPATIVKVEGKPWKIGTTSVSYETSGATMTAKFSDKGFAKGPLLKTGTTLDTIMTGTMSSMIMGGQLQLVTGTQTTCANCGYTSDPTGQITRLTIHFQPEPSLLVMLGAGAAGLALLGRARARR